MICREPIENGQVHILIVPAQFGALVPRRDRCPVTDPQVTIVGMRADGLNGVRWSFDS